MTGSSLTIADIEQTYREIMLKEPVRILATARGSGKTLMQQQLLARALRPSPNPDFAEQDEIINEIICKGSERNLLDYLLESDPDFEPPVSEKERLRPQLQAAMALLREHELMGESLFDPSRFSIRIEPEPKPGMWEMKHVPIIFPGNPGCIIRNVC